VSSAKPKIADYPFTTLKPNLGVVKNDFSSFVIADIPGLISGASSGAGLGFKFLKHLSRVKLLLHLVDLSSFDENELTDDIRKIEKELELYDSKLFKTDRWIILNKNDLNPEKSEIIKKFIENNFPNIPVYNISSVSMNGVKKLVEDISKWCLDKYSE